MPTSPGKHLFQFPDYLDIALNIHWLDNIVGSVKGIYFVNIILVLGNAEDNHRNGFEFIILL